METVLSSPAVQIATLTVVALAVILLPALQWLVARRLPVSVAGTYRKLAANTYVRVVLMLVPVFLAALLGYQKGTKWEPGFKHPKGFLPTELDGLDLFPG